jgi:hypothetical protein
MAGGFPMGLEFCNSITLCGIPGVSVASAAGTNTKGGFTTLIASTASDINLLSLSFASGSGTELVDIAIGAAASEVIIYSNILVPLTVAANVSVAILLPVTIPAGTRISARVQSNTASDAVVVWATSFDGAFTNLEGLAGGDGVGCLTASSKGTTVTCSASTNVKGSYAQLTASTARDYMGFFLMQDVNNLGVGSCEVETDVAIGGAGSEVIIASDVHTTGQGSNSTNTQVPGIIGPFWTPIPAGSRVALRAADSSGFAMTLDAAILGLYQ